MTILVLGIDVDISVQQEFSQSTEAKNTGKMQLQSTLALTTDYAWENRAYKCMS